LQHFVVKEILFLDAGKLVSDGDPTKQFTIEKKCGSGYEQQLLRIRNLNYYLFTCILFYFVVVLIPLKIIILSFVRHTNTILFISTSSL